MSTIQSNNNNNISSKYQTKVYSNYKQKWNINSLSTCRQFKAMTLITASKYQTIYIQTTNKNNALTHSLYVDNSKQQQVSIKPKYIQSTNKNKTLTHSLYVDNSKQWQQ